MNKEKIYYVYGYIRLDSNGYFYIGKGKNERYRDLNKRNPHFKNIINKVDIVVEILYDNLTEEQAFKKEIEVITDLVFNEGYSIEIKDFCNKNNGFYLVNQSFGGESASGYKHSEESKHKMSESRIGEKNVFYGKIHSDYTKNKISESRIKNGIAKGKNNPNYGKRGELSPIKDRKHSEKELEKMRNANPLRKEVFCIELNKRFSSLTYAEKYMKENYIPTFYRKTLSKKLKENKIACYGKIKENDEVIELHWKYV